MSTQTSFSQRQRGFGLIEVMVALLVLTIGILGVISMQVAGKRNLYEAQQRSLATSFARDVLERMRSNPATIGSYAATLTGSSQSDSASTLAGKDLYELEQALVGMNELQGTTGVGGLVSPTACITEASGVVTVAIAWLGVAEMTNPTESTCGNNPDVFGEDNVQRRLLVMSTYIEEF